MNQPLTALVEFQVRSETTSVSEWQDEWQVRAQDALQHEPETTAYAAAVNLEDDSSLLVFERYAHGASSLATHMARPAHSALDSNMGERRMTKRRVLSSQAVDVDNFGWWSRPANATPSQAGVILAVVGFRFEGPEQESSYLELARTHAAYTWDNEPDTLIYSVGRATADADREIDVLKGDLVFVMGCTDLDAVDAHSNDPTHLALGPKFAELEISVEPTFKRLYRTTGHGYLWRD